VTWKEFLNKTCWTWFALEIGTLLCRSILSAEPHEVSLLCFLCAIGSGHGVARVGGTTNGAQESKFVGGAMQLSERMANELGKGSVKLSSPVIRVDQSGVSSVNVVRAGGDSFSSSYVISAIPLALLNRVTFVPSLPSKKIQLIQRLPMGSVIKTMTFYDRAYWRDCGLSVEMMTDSGPVLAGYDDSKPDGSFPCLMGIIYAKRAINLAHLSPDERKQMLAKHYAELFRCPELLHPINYVEKNWAEDEYSGGCYSSNPSPGSITEFMSETATPFQKTYFAGTETACDFVGYMEGAIEAGERSARQILFVMGKISESEVWIDEPFNKDVSFPEVSLEMTFIEKILPSVPEFMCICATPAIAVAAFFVYKYFM